MTSNEHYSLLWASLTLCSDSWWMQCMNIIKWRTWFPCLRKHALFSFIQFYVSPCVTWQIDECASGWRAAVWDGKRYNVNLWRQVRDIQRQVGVSVCGKNDIPAYISMKDNKEQCCCSYQLLCWLGNMNISNALKYVSMKLVMSY